METTQIQGADTDAAGTEVSSLTTLLDPSAALAAARRLYAQNRSGLRFFCENRRVVSVDEAEAIDAGPEERDERLTTIWSC